MSASMKQRMSAGQAAGPGEPEGRERRAAGDDGLAPRVTPKAQYIGTKATSTIRAHTRGSMTSDVGA